MKLFDILPTIWAVISAMSVLVPLILLPFVGLVVFRAWQPVVMRPKDRWWAVTASVVFAMLDWALLTALPGLGLSFGPVGLPLLGITGIRMMLALSLAWLWRLIVSNSVNLTSWRSAFTGLILLWLLHVGVLAAEIEGMYFEPFDLSITELNVSGPPLLSDRPLRIVQLSDLHIERITKREREIIERINDLEPDIIVLTGDYLNTSYTFDPIAQHDARSLLAQLQAPYGVYAVIAKPVDPPEVTSTLFDDLDITLLDDQLRSLSFEGGELYLVGVTYTKFLERERDEAALSSLMAQVPQEGYSLLLYHTPDIVAAAAKEDVNLYLAGHTHGGQVRLPFYGAIITASEFGKKYEQGRYTVGSTTLYVSRGLGMEGRGAPRVRFMCPPEIVVVNLGLNGHAKE